MGGDEFALLLTEVAGIEDVANVAQKILENAREPFILDNHEVRITTSIGISDYPDDGEDIEILVQICRHSYESSQEKWTQQLLAL